MTKYDDVIARAVAAMPNDPEARRATYDRARAALTSRLRAVTPPLPEAAIQAEQDALEVSIQRAEMRFGNTSDQIPESPSPTMILRRQRHGIPIVVLCCAGIVAALIAILVSYPDWDTAGNSANRQPRQPMVQTNERASSAPNTDTQSVGPVPYVYMRQLVHYRSTNPAGTVVIDKAQRYLYVILANVTAIRYGISLGGNCIEAVGRYAVSRKVGAPNTPQSTSAHSDSSGDHALYLDSDTRLIHGTHVARSIGQSIKMGCFLLMPTDLAELYGRVPIGTRVVVN
jgi:lipoprotein-anchoring transpeptidase ErfK/SrfK